MKLQTLTFKLNEEKPLEASLIGLFQSETQDAVESIFMPKQTKQMINEQLKSIGCNARERDSYVPRIKNILNQFDESTDYPTT